MAYKDGIVAYDSYITSGDVIVDNRATKIIKVADMVIFPSGATCDESELIHALLNEPYRKDSEIAAIVLRLDNYTHNVYKAAIGEDGFWQVRNAIDKAMSIGTGSSFALGAMDAGSSAEESVLIACERDVYSGGKVNTFKLHSY